MKDFSKTLFHCSQLSNFMSAGQEKTPRQQYEDTVSLLEEEEMKYAAMAKKDSVSATKKLVKIKRLMLELGELETKKDDDLLPKGCKSHLIKVYAWEKYHKWSLPTGEEYNYIQKGNEVEEKSIELISQLDGKGYKKNNTRLRNEFLTGQPDIIEEDYIIDVKSSWDLNSFLVNIEKSLSSSYWWQMQGYFWLTGAAGGEVSFCLNSTSEDVIRQEIEKKNLLARYPGMDWLLNKYTYEDIPLEDRRIKFIVERNEEAIAKIPKRIFKCREYLFSLEQMHKETRLATNDL